MGPLACGDAGGGLARPGVTINIVVLLRALSGALPLQEPVGCPVPMTTTSPMATTLSSRTLPVSPCLSSRKIAMMP